MLTTVSHAWILDAVERRIITVSKADRENNEPQMYPVTWFYISFLPLKEAPQATRSLTTGVLGGFTPAPDPFL